MSDTPETDAAELIYDGIVASGYADAEICRKLERECNQLRAALQSVMDWNPKPEYWERPDTVARFEADMAKARKVLEETE